MQDSITINALKGLIIDGVHKAKSGHPGGAMSSLDFAYVLFTEFLRFDPDDSTWLGRDRFILSAGHESMLIYSLLHAIGWLPLDELKNFRQLHSKTPGHPENILTPGIECTTGPLGQGAAMSVGFALANRHLAASLDPVLFDSKTFALLGDGCMQEDVALGAASLAGHWGLNNLIWYYDKNHCQISGTIDRVTSDDEKKIFEGFGWRVFQVNAHDLGQLREALQTAREEKERPVLIVGDAIMAHGAATLEGSHETHGAPLPADEREQTKAKLGLPVSAEFYWPEDVARHFRRNFGSLREKAENWKKILEKRLSEDPEFRKKFEHCFVKEDLQNIQPMNWKREKNIATRVAFGEVLSHWADALVNVMGGSADLEPSNMTEAFAKKVSDFGKGNFQGRNLAFGVREFPMAAICNGMALHGGIIPFDATFLTFSDYARPAIRLGAIQKARVIHEFTHDSFYLGEDGPTHQPIEHIMSLRLIPDVYVMRPADPVETEILMGKALELSAQSVLCLTRQGVPYLPLDRALVAHAARGAYVVRDEIDADLLILATGSEVGLALEVAETLAGEFKCRVVSMPCWELFEQQDIHYQDSVLPPDLVRRVSIEAGSTLGWERYTGRHGLNIGIDHFGASAPAADLAREFGFTCSAITEKIRKHRFR